MKEGISFVTYNALLKTVHNINTYESRHQTYVLKETHSHRRKTIRIAITHNLLKVVIKNRCMAFCTFCNLAFHNSLTPFNTFNTDSSLFSTPK